ncbi:MAG TPA: family 20 glycosylhydrolase [Candidatus Acidoferrales bacterium]|nr:family 20 glycosylhydrolase [Candidatus Acidoferrales bacterium]
MSWRGGFMAHFAGRRQWEIATKIFCLRGICGKQAEKFLQRSRCGIRFAVAPGRKMGVPSGIAKHTRRCSYLLISLFALISSAATAHAPQSPPVPSPINLMPLPVKVMPAAGRLMVMQTFSVAIAGYNEPRLEHAAQRFLRDLNRQTGYFLSERLGDAAHATLAIQADHGSEPVQDLGEDESYVLEVTSAGAKLTAANPLGVMHGLQTFLQLVEVVPDGYAAPAIHIEDTPRFPWRGLSLDVSRHFISMPVLQRNVDALAAVKMNVLHLHLSDDQGFRLQSREFPQLQDLGSDGMYYSQAEMRELIAYASDRGIRIVPEFDMPGHSTAWFVGYPELSSGPGPYQIERRWGIFDPAMDPTRESTYKLLDKFIAEMASIFPDRYFHIGGDEVNGKQWDANAKIHEFMRAHNLKSNQELQQYFTVRVEKIVSKHHKSMVGWDEILTPGMPKDVVIQSWRGQESLAEAAKQGYRGILSSGYYLDAIQPAAQHYLVDPLSGPGAMLTPAQQKLILGGEACMWEEFASDESVESRIWPRAAAVAERLWSPQQVQDVNSMYRRMAAVSAQLEQLGLTHRSVSVKMLARLAGTDDIAALEVLARAAQPAGVSIRETEAEKAGGIQTSDVPLNRMVDAISPESEEARKFSAAVDQFVASKFQDRAAESYLRGKLTQWRDNDSALQPLLQNSFLLKEVVRVSQNLALLGAAGLQALDYIDARKAAPSEWRAQQVAMIQQAAKPTADLVLAVAPAVQKLVEGSAALTTP